LDTLSPLIIVEGTVIDYYLYFKVIFGKYLQTYEGTHNDMSPRTVDALAMGLNRNLEGGIRYFSLDSGYILMQQFCDIFIHKMPISTINRVKSMCKYQKSIKGLKFSN